VNYLALRGIKLSIASNGYTLTTIPGDILGAFHDVEVSIDFPTQAEQDNFRGAGNWDLVHQAIERCKRQGVEVSILATLMRTNFGKMGQMVGLARKDGVNLRVNAYQAVKSNYYRLTYDEFWEGYQQLFSKGLLVSCSEPVVRAALGLGKAQSPCGRQSVRVNPRGQIIPCVYWPVEPNHTPTIENLTMAGEEIILDGSFEAARAEPLSAISCPCHGGCASRRALNRNLDAHDDYCPWVRGDDPDIIWKPAPVKYLMRSSNVCTTVVV